MLKTVLALTALSMALGVFVNARTEHWELVAVLGVIGLGALALLAVVIRTEGRQPK